MHDLKHINKLNLVLSVKTLINCCPNMLEVQRICRQHSHWDTLKTYDAWHLNSMQVSYTTDTFHYKYMGNTVQPVCLCLLLVHIHARKVLAFSPSSQRRPTTSFGHTATVHIGIAQYLLILTIFCKKMSKNFRVTTLELSPTELLWMKHLRERCNPWLVYRRTDDIASNL